MDAIEVVNRREFLRPDLHQELVVWRVPVPLRGSVHHFKYRLALVADGICVLRYDNEAGKGDHRHFGPNEGPYVFSGVRALFQDFDRDVARWIDDNRGD
jgi:hypothetical protein